MDHSQIWNQKLKEECPHKIQIHVVFTLKHSIMFLRRPLDLLGIFPRSGRLMDGLVEKERFISLFSNRTQFMEQTRSSNISGLVFN